MCQKHFDFWSGYRKEIAFLQAQTRKLESLGIIDHGSARIHSAGRDHRATTSPTPEAGRRRIHTTSYDRLKRTGQKTTAVKKEMFRPCKNEKTSRSSYPPFSSIWEYITCNLKTSHISSIVCNFVCQKFWHFVADRYLRGGTCLVILTYPQSYQQFL